MAQTRQATQGSNRVRKTRRSSTQESRRQNNGFITWTDWRAFQPSRSDTSNKNSDDDSPKYSHTGGWHPDAFADRYRRSSCSRISSLPTKNLNVLNSQRITGWERDFFSSLLIPDQSHLPEIKTELDFASDESTTVSMKSLEIATPTNDDITNPSDKVNVEPLEDNDMDMTIMSSIDFDFEKCLAEVEQIVCDSLKDIPSIFDNQDRADPKRLRRATTSI